MKIHWKKKKVGGGQSGASLYKADKICSDFFKSFFVVLQFGFVRQLLKVCCHLLVVTSATLNYNYSRLSMWLCLTIEEVKDMFERCSRVNGKNRVSSTTSYSDCIQDCFCDFFYA